MVPPIDRPRGAQGSEVTHFLGQVIVLLEVDVVAFNNVVGVHSKAEHLQPLMFREVGELVVAEGVGRLRNLLVVRADEIVVRTPDAEATGALVGGEGGVNDGTGGAGVVVVEVAGSLLPFDEAAVFFCG